MDWSKRGGLVCALRDSNPSTSILRHDAADEIEKLHAAMGEILSLQPLKTQHEHYIAMLKTLEIVRKAVQD